MSPPRDREVSCSPIVELRQYILHPGRRDVLIELFDREFIETQEVLGMTVIGQFRDLDDPDRFVWIRGFHDMRRRAEGLQAFYDGPVWREHRAAANATMIDSDNVLLLRPARPSSGFSPDLVRPAHEDANARDGMVVAAVCPFVNGRTDESVGFAEGTLRPALLALGAHLLAYFVTEDTPNNFPRLPVREDAHVFVWFAGFAGVSEARQVIPDGGWSRWISMPPGTDAPLQVLRLLPTSRSAVTGSSTGCATIPH